MRRLHALPSPAAAAAVLARVQWPGRFERLETPPLVLDGAHNEHAARVLAATWKEEFPGRKAALVFAASADKHIREMIPVLREIAGEWHLVPCTSPRIMPAQEMAALLAGQETGPFSFIPRFRTGCRRRWLPRSPLWRQVPCSFWEI